MTPSRPEAEAALLEQVRARRKSLRSAGIVIFVICFGSGVLFQLIAADGGFVRPIAGLVFGGVLGGAFLLLSLGDPRKHGAVIALLDQPASVVWLYMAVPRPPPPGYQRISTRGGAGSTLFVCRDNGLRIPFEVKRPDEERILALASALAPGATVGWSPEADAHYTSAPASLRRVG